MKRQKLIIDNLNVRLPNGWKGDPIHLARQISEQIQCQATELKNTKKISISMTGNYSGVASQVTKRLSTELTSVKYNNKLYGKDA